jgi:serine/threonine protein kinase
MRVALPTKKTQKKKMMNGGGELPPLTRKASAAAESVTPLSQQGTVINPRQYAKVRDLGKGSHGVCAVVRQITSGKHFVMKEVDMTGMDKKMQQCTMNESMVLCNLNHPNIIRYEGSAVSEGREDATLNILMEYAAGGDMYARIARQRGRGPISEIQVVDWFIQTLLAVKYMHKQHILHRDIKSHNVFLTADGVVKLGDFGICRVLDHTLQNAYSFVGTPYYLSPELLLRKPYNYASDMWALGVLLCELMVQAPPFQGHDMDSLRKSILSGRFTQPSPAVYSKDIRAIVSMLLQQNPKARPCANRIMNHPYIKTRIAMWYEEASTLRIPKPPEWYLKEIRQMGLLDEILTPTFSMQSAMAPILPLPSSNAPLPTPTPQPQPHPPPVTGRPPLLRKPVPPSEVNSSALPQLITDNTNLKNNNRGHGRRHFLYNNNR